MAKTNWLPQGFRTVTPHLVVAGCAKAIEFYAKAFGAEEVMRMPMPDGRIGHAELKIGDSIVMLADDMPEMMGGKSRDPKKLGASAVTIHLYVPDAKAFVDRAAKAGATVTMPVAEMFWGDLYGKLLDPFGHDWGIATHVKDLTPQEIAAAQKKAFGG
jgi:uncharacterized glyoxalase superfamily protein PhnB